MNTKLAEFLTEQAGTPFKLGQSDCALWLADWLMAARGIPDPAAGLRGRYATPRGWITLAGRDGLPGIIARVAASVGLSRTDDPLPGDISVVTLPNGHEAGAIMGTKGWVIRCGEFAGVGMGPVSVLAAWRV